MYDLFCWPAAVTDIDTSGIHALEELHRSLQKRNVQVNGYLGQEKDLVWCIQYLSKFQVTSV